MKQQSIFLTLAFVLLSLHTYSQNNDFPFEVEISGTGSESIIFIPGFACSGDVWTDTKVLFEKDYTCHILTMAGFAGVPAQTAPSFVGWEKTIAKYIEEKKIEKPIVVGHSLGGTLALALAADYPQLISKVVVVDALPCLAAMMNPAFEADENPDCSAAVQQITATSDEQFYVMQKMGMMQYIADTSKHEMVIDWSLKSDRTTMGEIFCQLSNTDLRTKIKSIECPTLVLLEAPFVNFKAQISEQYKKLKTADLRFATKGLHFIMYDDAEWYNKQLQEFIK